MKSGGLKWLRKWGGGTLWARGISNVLEIKSNHPEEPKNVRDP